MAGKFDSFRAVHRFVEVDATIRPEKAKSSEALPWTRSLCGGSKGKIGFPHRGSHCHSGAKLMTGAAIRPMSTHSPMQSDAGL
jgi:hypothetical protein